jgi:hypothetical protein
MSINFNTLFDIQSNKDCFIKRLNEFKCIFNKDKLKMYLKNDKKHKDKDDNIFVDISIIIVYDDLYQSIFEYKGPILGNCRKYFKHPRKTQTDYAKIPDRYINENGTISINSISLYENSTCISCKINYPTLYIYPVFELLELMYNDYINLGVNINYLTLLKTLSIIPIINKKYNELYTDIYEAFPKGLINKDVFSIIACYL